MSGFTAAVDVGNKPWGGGVRYGVGTVSWRGHVRVLIRCHRLRGPYLFTVAVFMPSELRLATHSVRCGSE